MQTIDHSALALPESTLAALSSGETIAVQGPSGAVLAFIGPPEKLPPHPLGICKGQFSVPDDFNDPLPEVEDFVYGRE